MAACPRAHAMHAGALVGALCLTLPALSAIVTGCATAPRAASPPAAALRAASDPGPNTPDSTAPKELLDEDSATTLIVVRRPLVLARSRTDVAANVRDYVTLVAAQEDRSGRYTTWLIGYRWSTVDARIERDQDASSGRLMLIADGRSIALSPVQQPPGFLQRGDLLYAPRSRASAWAYAVDLATLRYIASTRDLSVRFVDDSFPLGYTLWEDGRRELQGLLRGAVAP